MGKLPLSDSSSFVGRADVLRACRELGNERAQEVAFALGFRWAPPKPDGAEPKGETGLEVRASEPNKQADSVEEPSAVPEPVVPIPFWRPVHREYLESDTERSARRNPLHEPEAQRELSGQDLGAVALPPPGPPIVPPGQLWRRLDAELTLEREGRELDVEGLVDRVSRGDAIHSIPLEASSRTGSIVLILDAPHRLMAVWRDQLALIEELAKRLGADRIRMMPPPRDFEAEDEPPTFGADEVVLALTDLGFYADAYTQRRWLRLGRRLRTARVKFLALVPCPAHRWNRDLAKLWSAIDWSSPNDAGQRRRPGSLEGHAPKELAPEEVLLRLLAPAIRIEPGLLRAVRKLLGQGADLGTEVNAWNHPAVAKVSTQCLELDAEQARRWAADRFGDDWSSDLVAEVARTVVEWHEGWSNVLWASELGHYRALGVADKEFGLKRVERAEAAFARAANALGGGARGASQEKAVAGWWERETPRLPEALSRDERFGDAVVAVARARHERDPEAPLPLGVTPEMISRPDTDHELRRYALRQHGDRLVVTPKGTEAPGSLLVEFEAKEPSLTVSDGHSQPQPLPLIESRAELPAPTLRGRLQLTTDVEAITLSRFETPSWARRSGRDGYGAWASFEIEGIEQRMRWIPPGRFLMGSPESEEGSFGDERPQHEVILSEGFWMAETPCTQALWEAVMGANPSVFKTADRPVERVSWHDSHTFIDRLNFSIRDLELALPSEAEWEYACRAGTEGATWKGELDRFHGRSSVLEDIAWYDENSGEDFDLEGESQGTRRVGQKLANPWGLRDLLGNVLEWCWTEQEVDTSYGQLESVNLLETEFRNLRGGSWLDKASDVHVSNRLGDLPVPGYSSIGFRLSRGPKERGAPGGERGSAGAGVARRGTSRSPRSQRDRAWVDRLGWAADGGLDDYGRWAELEVEGVRHRLRWMYPGTFQMGSPETETGRDNDEGPRHDVTLTEGFWLGEVPCTQDLWEAVMGSNPSTFVSPRRPVEQVSWEDCQEFFTRLRELAPRFVGRLPTEAQWEYGCRAGTKTATWAGDLKIRGENDAEPLHKIAWYGGNSGVGFDLENGWDTSDWKEKGFDFARAGTRLVGHRQRNPWGLYDMLGNVWEWCEDSWDFGSGYPGGARVDPVGTGGESRVLRGGSWDDGARFVRAAYRDGYRPGLRFANIGFRLSRGPNEPGEAEPQKQGAEPKGREADRGRRPRDEGGESPWSAEGERLT